MFFRFQEGNPMINPTLIQQMKACIKAGITIFESKYGKHELFCPGCREIGRVQNTQLVCDNEYCRVEGFYSK